MLLSDPLLFLFSTYIISLRTYSVYTEANLRIFYELAAEIPFMRPHKTRRWGLNVTLILGGAEGTRTLASNVQTADKE